MKFLIVEDNDFGSGWRWKLGMLHVDWTKYENHWSLQIMWYRDGR